MNTAMPEWFIFVVFFGLIVDAVGGWLSGRTARSKGYSFGLFFGLSFLSWFVMATIAVFIKSRAEYRHDQATEARSSLSRILYFIGLGAFILGPFSVSLSPAAYQVLSGALLSQIVAIGAISLTIMGIGLIMASVATARNKAGDALANFKPDIN